MILISENYIIILLVTISIISLITYLRVSYHKLKTTETNRLHLVYLELEIEKKNKLSLKNTSSQLDALELKTKKSFQKINVEIFNIDFSYKEVLANL